MHAFFGEDRKRDKRTNEQTHIGGLELEHTQLVHATFRESDSIPY